MTSGHPPDKPKAAEEPDGSWSSASRGRTARGLITADDLRTPAVAGTATAIDHRSSTCSRSRARPEFPRRIPYRLFDPISRATPVIADLKPGGRFMAPDMSAAGGSALLGRRLMEGGLIVDSATVTGRSLFSYFADAAETPGQEVIVTAEQPIKERGGFAIVYGNVAPEGCVVKLAGHGKLRFEGPARL